MVLVSPSTQGQQSIACSVHSLQSFEELHYLAAAHDLAERLCVHPHIEGAVGLWHGQAENSGMIDGCSAGGARELGALLGRYYHQKAALLFDRKVGGEARLVSFESTQPLSVIATTLTRDKASGATVIPRPHDSLILMVATDQQQLGRARRVSSQLGGHSLREETGTAELLGGEDRVKARAVYENLLAHSPADVQQLERAMYTQQFADLGIDAGPQ